MRLGEGLLLHYTNSLEVLLDILNEGFIFVPNKRNLMPLFLDNEWPPNPFYKGMINLDPQEFGMVSFSQIGKHEIKYYSSKFGKFAIGVSWQWAAERGVDRVIYIHDSGNIFNAFQYLFQKGIESLKTGLPDEEDGFFHVAIENERIAALVPGGDLYQNLLRIYEYMEPEENANQREWRITSAIPDYSFTGEKSVDISRAKREAWKIGKKSLSLSENDIKFLLVPWTYLPKLYWKIPKKFRRIKIIPVGFSGK